MCVDNPDAPIDIRAARAWKRGALSADARMYIRSCVERDDLDEARSVFTQMTGLPA